jgi:hypothetical protein
VALACGNSGDDGNSGDRVPNGGATGGIMTGGTTTGGAAMTGGAGGSVSGGSAGVGGSDAGAAGAAEGGEGPTTGGAGVGGTSAGVGGNGAGVGGTSSPGEEGGPCSNGNCNSTALWCLSNRCAQAAFVDNGDGTVTEGGVLQWQQAAPNDVLSWDAANSYCSALDLAGGGWRLPTLPELRSIVNPTFRPTIDPAFFPNTIGFLYATSARSGNDISYVQFTNGAVVVQVDNGSRVRCARPSP